MKDTADIEPAVGGKFKAGQTSLKIILAVLAMVLVGTIGAAFWLDSDSGHQFIIEQVEELEPENGLRIESEHCKGPYSTIHGLRVLNSVTLREYFLPPVKPSLSGIRWPGFLTN